MTKSAKLVVAGIENLQDLIRIPYFLIGFLLVGILTSTPELTIGIVSAIKRIPTLSLGNLLGGSFVLLSLVAGLVAIFYGELSFKRTFTLKELVLTGLVILVPAILGFDRQISQIDGSLIILIYFLFALVLKNHSRPQRKNSKSSNILKKIYILVKVSLLVILGVIFLLVSSAIIVGAAQKIISIFNITPIVVGLIILSIGTNLPEIAIAFKSQKDQEQKDIAEGVILGSAAANSLIVGIVSLINPISIFDFASFLTIFYFLAIGVFIFILFAKTKNIITPSEGLLLVILYVAFLVSQIFLSAAK